MDQEEYIKTLHTILLALAIYDILASVALWLIGTGVIVITPVHLFK